ncbi:hypothetical protein BKCO1_1030003 [Neofusicoccum parvum]|nr:hypothetical protein BKCO1_1030003 [Neofusicoccum parvum]
MSPATRQLRSGATYSTYTQDKSRVAKRKSPAPKAPLATLERTSARKFRWTEKRDRALLIHLIGLGDIMSDNEYTKLAMLWDGATADDVHARVEFLRAQQVLTIRTEEPDATAAATLMVAVDAIHASITDNTEHAANEDDIASDCSSPLSSPPSSLHSPTPTPSPPPSSNPTSSASEEDEDNDDVEPAKPAPQLKSALKSRTTTGPGKTVRFPAVIATVRACSPRPNHHLNKKRDFLWPTERPRGWVPTANAKWEDEMFDADDDDDASTTATEDNHPEASPSPQAPSLPSKRTHDDFSADSPPSPSDDTVPRGRPAKRLHASPSRPVSRTHSHSRLTASHRYRASTPTASPRRFNNYLPAFPRPVKAMAAVCASAAWLDESDDEGETRRLQRRRRGKGERSGDGSGG